MTTKTCKGCGWIYVGPQCPRPQCQPPLAPRSERRDAARCFWWTIAIVVAGVAAAIAWLRPEHIDAVLRFLGVR